MTATLWWLVQNSIAVAVLAGVVWVACRLLHTRPALQHALWLVVLIKFVTPPIVAWPWSASDIGDRIAMFVTPIDNEIASSPADMSKSDHRSRFNDGSPVAAVPAVSNRTAELVESTSELMAASPPARGSETAIRFALWVFFGLWLAGFVIALAVEVRRIARHEAVVRRARPAPQPLVDEIAAVAGKLGLRPVPALVVPQIATPFVWCLGWLRLIWPEDLSRDTDLKRHRGIIAHELAHVKRRDHWVAWLELVAGCLWWWNPLIWYVRRQLRETADLACDAQALSLVPSVDRRGYAETFLELSYLASQRQTPAPALGVSTGARRTVERRLSMILNEHVKARTSCLGLLVAALLALVALPAWSLGQEDANVGVAHPEPRQAVPENSKANQSDPHNPIAQRLLGNTAVLTGRWFIAHVEHNGQRDPRLNTPLAKEEQFTAVITADTIDLKMFSSQMSDPGVPVDVPFLGYKIDPLQDPKRIEITMLDGPAKGRSVPGIYALDGDELRLCFQTESRRDAKPPVEFTTEPRSGHVMFVLLKQDKEKLQGRWKVLSTEDDGEKKESHGLGVGIEGDKLVVAFFLGGTPAGSEFTFTLNASAHPKRINLTGPMPIGKSPDSKNAKPGTSEGIYSLGGDTLKICLAPPGNERPTVFSSKPGSGCTLLTLQRDTPEKTEKARQGEGKKRPADSKKAGGAAGAVVPVVGPVGLRRQILIPPEPSGLKRHILTPQEPSVPEKPAEKAEGDARFIRGLYLDLLGVPPSAQDVRRFVEDEKPSHVKRVAEIDRVLSDPRYADKGAEQWLQKVKETRIEQLESELHGLLERQHALLADLKNHRATEIEREGTENAMRAVRRMSLDLLGLPITDPAALDVREIVRETARRLLEKGMIHFENPIDSAIRAKM